MARAQLRAIVRDRAGNVLQNAKVFVWETATTTPVADLYASPSGGAPQGYLISDSKGVALGYLTAPRDVAVHPTDNGGTSYYPSDPGTLVPFTAYTVDPVPLFENPADESADDDAFAAHLVDTTDAHDASAVSFVPAGTISATDVQAAIEEVAAATDDAVLPPTALAVRYAAPWGDNANDGLSWASAFEDVLTAFDDLPSTFGGTIEFADSTYVDSTNHARGLWLTDGSTTVPTGWRIYKPLNLIGVGGGQVPVLTRRPVAAMIGGSATMPCLWIADGVERFHGQDMWAFGLNISIRVGVAPDGTRTGGGAVNSEFDNVVGWASFNANTAGYGPAWDIGYCFDITFRTCVGVGNPTEAWDSDTRAAWLLKSDGGNPGILRFIDCSSANGAGIKSYVQGAGGAWSLDVENFLMEGQGVDTYNAPGVWFTGSGAPGSARLNLIQMADAANGNIAVRNDCLNADALEVGGCSSTVQGPMKLLSRYPSTAAKPGFNAARDNLIGILERRGVFQHDAARRSFGPAAVQAANLAAQDVSTWAALVGGATVTTGKRAPDGTMQAAQLSVAAGSDTRQWFRGNRTFAVGDHVIAGVWARPTTDIGPQGTALSVLFNDANATLAAHSTPTGVAAAGGTQLAEAYPLMANRDWEWLYVVGEIGTANGSPSDTAMYGDVYVGNAIEFYMPVFLHIPAATLSANEAWELALHLQSFPNGAPTGTVALPRGVGLWTPSATQTGDYTLVLYDTASVVEMNKATAVNVTIPPNSSVPFPVGASVDVYQQGAGQVTTVAGAGVTLRAPNGAKTAAQYSVINYRQRAVDEWVVSGDAAV